MAKYDSIEEYRVKKKRKNFLKRFFLIAVIALILVILLNVLQNFKGAPINEMFKTESDNGSDLWPVVMKNEQLIDLFCVGNQLGVLTKANIITLSENGKVENNISHGFTNPVVREGNKRILTYDRGGVSFRLDTAKGTIGEKTITGEIILAQVSSNGNVAVVSTHERYASIITVYNSKLEEIYRYSVIERISAVCFSPDNQHVLAAAITTVDGILSANLYELNINDVDKIKMFSVNDIVPLDISYNEKGNINIVSDKSMAVLNTKTGTSKIVPYDGKLLQFKNSSPSETVLANTNYLNNNSTLSIVDNEGTIKYMYDINDEILDIYSDGSRVVVLGKRYVYTFDMTLMLLNKIATSNSYKHVAYNGNSLYMMSSDSIAKDELQ